MTIKKMFNQRGLHIAFLLIFGFLISLRLYPAFTLPIFMDEGDDLYILAQDIASLPHFFSDQSTHAWDQSRLPHLIAAVVVGITGMDASNVFQRLGFVRLVFLLFHIGFLFISYRLIRSVFREQLPALLYLLLLTSSCYLASFSIAALTSGDTVYLFFHILCLKIFFDHFLHAGQSGRAFRRFLLFSLIMACCIAGKLFGVMLLAALFVFHLFHQKNLHALSITGTSPRKLFMIATVFLTGILAINILPIAPALKTGSALAAAAVYFPVMIRCMVQENRQDAPSFPLPFFRFWFLLTYISFTFVLILSPIYLNLKNLLNVFGWYNTWNMGEVAPDAAFREAAVTMAVKFGLLPSLLLAVALSAVVFLVVRRDKKTAAPSAGGFWNMILIVFSIHLFFISVIQFKLVWHSLAVFPFLYLPFIWLFHYCRMHRRKIAAGIVLTMIILVTGDNLYRYGRWYPYGHLDGGQYGRQYIGINKPCFVTFEAIPLFYDYIRQKENDGSRPVRQINVRASQAPVLNNYLRKMLIRYFRSHGEQQIRFVSRELRWDPSDLVLSSPIYNPEFETFLRQNNYRIVHPLAVSGLVIGHVWKHNQTR